MIPRKYGKNARRLCFIFLVAGGGGGGGSGKQACRWGEGVCKKGPFMATKWAQNGVILVGLDLDSVGYIHLAQ